MIEIIASAEFVEHYQKLPASIQKKIEKQEKIFSNNPQHPSLHTEKLEPKNKQIWSFRVDKQYRVLFRYIVNNKILLLTVGSHSWIYKIKF